jgi:hypothetical protein
MFIEWAIGCAEVEKASPGYDILAAAQTGFIAQPGDLPRYGYLTLFVCIRMEPGDEQGGVVYDFQAIVSGPDGPQTPIPFRMESGRDTSPKQIHPERHYTRIDVEAYLTREGQYLVTLRDVTGERYVQPYYFAVLPTP